MSQLKIRVGASVDRSLSEAYKPLIEAAKRARAAVENEGKRAGATVGKEHKKGTDAAEKEYAKLARDAEKWHRQMVRDAEKALQQELRAKEKATRDAEKLLQSEQHAHERAEREKTRATEREAGRRNRELERGLRSTRQGGQVASFAGRAALGAGRMFMGIAASRARAAGVDFDVESMFRKNTELETTASKISNSGLIESDARNAARVDPKLLMSQALDVGAKTGTDANVALEGMEKFVAKTGDLATGQQILERMAIQAKATGSSLGDMLDAAGDIANALGDTEDKGRKIDALMKAFSGQGKLGAVEIKNLASQMAKLGAASGTFEGGEQSLIQMGVLAQMSRAKGGSSSATQAATSVASFANTFSKGARLDAFQNMGVDVRGKNELVRSPKALIVDAIRAASATEHGGMANFDRNMGKMFMDVRARSATRGFETVFKQAGGGEEGIKAVIREFEKLENSVMADAEVMESFKRAMQTSESQAESLNAAMRKNALEMQEALLPAVAALAPAMISATREVAGFVSWLAGKSATEQIQGKATADVENALSSSDKQIKGGKISAAQMEMNRVAQNEAREAALRTKADVDLHKGDAYSPTTKKLLRMLDYTPAGAVTKRAFGMGVGEAAVERNEQDQRGRQVESEKAALHLRQMSEENQRIRSLLEKGLVVRVESLPSTPPGAAPGVPQMPSEPGKK